MQRYVIVGSGVAGISAIEALRETDRSGEITLIGDEVHNYYSRPGLAYYLTGELAEEYLFPLSRNDFKNLNLRHLQARVVSIDPLEHRLRLNTGETLNYDRLLIAVGASALSLNIPGNDLAGVVKLDNLEDARQIIRLARKARRAVVVGGGITALEIVEGLLARGVRTHFLLRGETYWSNVLDQVESGIVLHKLQEEGVQVHFNTEIEKILGNRGKVAGIQTRDGQRLACGILAYAIGVRPRIQLAQASGLKTNRGILVDNQLRTNASDVFAAGDVAEVYDPFSGRSVIDSLWGPARDQGRIAGKNMAGVSAHYSKPIPFNVTRLANLTTMIIGTVGKGVDHDLVGIARGDSETWRQLPEAIAAQSDFDVNRLRILVGQRTLLGAIVMGDQSLSKALHHLIINKVDISAIRDRLLQAGAPLASLITDHYLKLREADARTLH
ncbi:MAG TPA: FAD-dependent oxidoreductase [Anaerolineales bacterium]|nr:FAD-dependent oxidoreductase [Anaerolineales bacterium]